MIKSQSIKVLFGVLMLCCVPAAAQVALGVAGAQIADDGTLMMFEGSTVELRSVANAGDTVAVLIAPMDANGQPDYSVVGLLLIDVDSKTGAVSGQFQVPKGFTDMSFQLIAAARDVFGNISLDTATMVIRAH
jgi:hypothetical protein